MAGDGAAVGGVEIYREFYRDRMGEIAKVLDGQIPIFGVGILLGTLVSTSMLSDFIHFHTHGCCIQKSLQLI